MFIASALALMLTASSLQTAAPTQSSPAQPDPASLERIKQSLAKPPAVDVTAEVRMLVPERQKTPTFRVSIEEKTPAAAWEDRSMVPLYVRTSRPAYHHEYLMQVTPEEFRSATLYPGVNVLPALEAFFDAVSHEIREQREAEVRRKIRKELERFKWQIQQ